jgi:hypothetical protein
MCEDRPLYGANQAITLRQHLMNNLEQGHYTPAQMREMLLTAVSTLGHYWDLDRLAEAAERADVDSQGYTIT